MTYADTSFLASLYIEDANTDRAVELAEGGHGSYPLTPFLRLELRNAVRLAAFRKMIASRQATDILQDIEDDRQGAFLADTPAAWTELLERAEMLSAGHTAKTGIRTLDLIHVATAVTLGVDTFLTFDARQRALALKVGLKVLPEADG